MKSAGPDSSATDVLSLCFRLILGCVFFYAGAIKVVDPQGFALSVYNYHIVPGWLVNPVAILLPWVEVVMGAALILGVLVPGASLVVSGLLLVFVCAQGLSLVRGLDISCGCFSTSREAGTITWLFLVRDGALLAMAWFVFTVERGRWTLSGLIRSGSHRNAGS